MYRNNTREVFVGEVGVDSGSIIVGDPCYVISDKRDSDPALDWMDVVNQMFDDTGRPLKGKAGTSALEISNTLITGTPYGDGSYPVYAEVDGDGQIFSIRIDLSGDEDEDEDCGGCGYHINDCTCYDDEDEDDDE